MSFCDTNSKQFGLHGPTVPESVEVGAKWITFSRSYPMIVRWDLNSANEVTMT